MLARDANGDAIQALRPVTGGAHQASKVGAGAFAGRIGPFAAGTKAIALHCDGIVRFKLGNNAVTAGAADHRWKAEFAVAVLSIFPSEGARDTHIAFYAEGGDATVYVSELE